MLVRSNGTITAFDPTGSVDTYASGINSKGVVVGGYTDRHGVIHGYIRAVDGTIKTFNAPGAEKGTFPISINARGEIAGKYRDDNFLGHGFLRTK